MGKNSNKRLIETIVISGLGVAIGYIINFLVTPYITEHLGVEAYGFVSIAKFCGQLCGNFDNCVDILYS